MTEAEWLACRDPGAMLAHLGKKTSDRKLRLFCCACCRRVWDFVRDERLQSALDLLERYADQEVSDKKRLEAGKAAAAFQGQFWDETGKEEEVCIATELWNTSTKSMRRVIDTCGESAAAAFAWGDVGDFTNRTGVERGNQTALLRDIFGNPFRAVEFDAAWRTSDAVLLAQGIYDKRAFDRMPILADALQDAGCDNAEVLNHCRDASLTHVRGCWAVDLVLGKE